VLRRRSAVAVSAVLAVALGCNDYQFSPAGHCLIQPGTRRETLDKVSTVDLLFVVDDSDSMTPDQENLARSFSTFISNLNATNAARVGGGLEPIDFHIAITTTSVFENFADVSPYSCQTGCTGLSGSYCCDGSHAPQRVPQQCGGGAGCGGGASCRTDCAGFAGVPVCCSADGKTVQTVPVACDVPGQRCGDWKIQYLRNPPTCVQGVGTPGAAYPHGSFVAAAGNPRVLHFEKALFTSGNAAAVQALATQFTQNVRVGSCGSGEEQGLQAARLALEKAAAGQQREADGSKAAWPHEGSKIVLVFVGDEDDCSSPEDPMKGIILSGGPGADTCVSNEGNKEYDTAAFVDYFSSLRPPSLLGAAFVVSTGSATCQDLSGANACTAGSNPPTCGSAAGRRFLQVASALQARGSEVVVGPVCDPDFGPVLNRIAEIAKPPSVLALPTEPASNQLVVLRIVGDGGLTRKTCAGPAPAGTSAADAAARYDWWFTRTERPMNGGDDGSPQALSQYVYINHARGGCEANPGETYSADYLGRVPDAGCRAPSDCQAALGGAASAWQCCTGFDAQGACVPPAADPGTCLCKTAGG
jgi:hypothetical protein